MPDPEPSPASGPWRVATTGDGSRTLVHPVHGEACHSSHGAWSEARERYAGPCRLAELARASGVVRVLDVGTGLGLNIAAALEAAHGAALEVWSLESDPGVLRAALAIGPEPLAAPWHGIVLDALRRALDVGSPAARRGAAFEDAAGRRSGRLRLVLGDARLTVRELPADARFDAVFLDAFSPGVDPALWEPAFLARVARHMTPSALLSTYSCARSARAGLRAAGLRVGAGGRVGAKRSGTLASLEGALPPLDPREARRLARG